MRAGSGRRVGIDHGDKRFGIAISDPSGMLATPRDVVEGEPAVLRYLDTLIPEEQIVGIVLGLPRNMDGSLGPRAEKVLAFRKKLEERFEVPVDTWDERLTSFQAESLLTEAGVRGAERKARVDKVAAQIILQGWLDNERALGDSAGDSPSDNSVGES